jgi:hypothetical protein
MALALPLCDSYGFTITLPYHVRRVHLNDLINMMAVSRLRG